MSTFAKTRFCSHRDFVSTCLRRSVIPVGFRISTRPCLGRISKDTIEQNLLQCSRRLMHLSLESYHREVDHHNSAIAERRNHLDSLCNRLQFGSIRMFIHNLNRFGPVPLMIILGDSLHNFGDGLAIGAAFTLGVPAGLSTSIAVLCHEIPHELGDLAVLLNQGMRLSTAVCMNFLSACVCFMGLWVGIPLAQTQSAREWIFAATAGMFLYVGLVSMLPLLHAYKGKRNGVIFLLQNVGFLVGVALILVIALYEDAINVAI